MTLDHSIHHLNNFADSETRLPTLFVGHGSPMNAIEDNEFSRAWAETGTALPRPKAILCISAHWETAGTQVTAMEQPKTIHDFYGFPQPLYEMRYPAPGSPGLARLTRDTLRKTGVRLDSEWGLDHGAWSVLCRMFPGADIPVVQLSLDRTREPAFHYDSIVHYSRLGQAARLSVPTNEHFLPLLYILALQDRDESVEFFAEQVTSGSLSMRSLKIG